MLTGNAARQLRTHGVAILRAVFPKDLLAGLNEAAARCFDAVRAGQSLPEHHRFNPFSHSVLAGALLDFGCASAEQIRKPLSTAALDSLFAEAMDGEWSCRMEQSWVRKKFAPVHAPGLPYHSQDWHQDGALGVQFPLQPGPAVPMTQLLTCWIPLNACGVHSPGLEFICCRQAGLLHFTELGDAALRQRFAPEEFRAPSLDLGDGLVFLNSTLHRTYTHPQMLQDRMSVEYRIFPR
jgi:hypothetical protein